MITVDVQTLSTIASVIVVGLGIAGYLRGVARDLKADTKTTRDELGARIDKVDAKVDKVDAKVDNRIDSLTAHVDAGFQAMGARLTTLEQRTYDLSTRLPPAPASSQAE